MPEDITQKLIIGSKQVKRCLKKEGQIKTVIIARDAKNQSDIDYILEECKSKGIPVVYEESMKELGRKCQIDVSAAVIALMI